MRKTRSRPNFRRALLKTFSIAVANDSVDLHQAPTWALAFFLSLTVTIAGGTTSGTLLTEHLLRLVDLEVIWDGVTILPRVPAYWVAAMYKRSVNARAPRYTGLANSAAQSVTVCEAYFELPFARGWLLNPVETILSVGKVENMFRLNVYWNTTANAGAASAAGTGALVDAGDRVITTPTAPTLKCYQLTVPGAPAPEALPIYELYRSAPFTAANANNVVDIKAPRPIDAIFFRDSYGAQYRLQDGINAVTLQSASEQHIYGPYGYPELHYKEATEKPGVSETGADDMGYGALQFTEGGRLTNALDPRKIQSLQLVVDHDAPTANPGEIQFLLSELLEWPGVTKDSVPVDEAARRGRGNLERQPRGRPDRPARSPRARRVRNRQPVLTQI